MADNQFRNGYFLPTTTLWDVNPINDKQFNAASVSELILRLHQQMNNLALAINAKDTGFYVEEEFIPGQQWFTNPLDNTRRSSSRVMRQVFRKVINFGALPNNGTKSVAHEIDVRTGITGTKWTRIFGTATDTATGDGQPLADFDTQLWVDATNVNVATTQNFTNFDHTVIVLEYLQE